MKSPPKVETLSELSPAEKRELRRRENRLDFIAYKRARKATVAQLSGEFAYSHDSIQRYLTGASPVPGDIVSELRRWRAAA